MAVRAWLGHMLKTATPQPMAAECRRIVSIRYPQVTEIEVHGRPAYFNMIHSVFQMGSAKDFSARCGVFDIS